MNWSRGLFRTWAAVTALWLVSVSLYLFAEWPGTPIKDYVATAIYWALGLPFGLLAIGWGALWVRRGFTHPTQPEVQRQKDRWKSFASSTAEFMILMGMVALYPLIGSGMMLDQIFGYYWVIALFVGAAIVLVALALWPMFVRLWRSRVHGSRRRP